MKKPKKDLKKELRKYKKLALKDELTGLYNRRKLNIDLDSLVYEKSRYKARFSMVIVDVNGLKAINDTKGHLEGDKILIKLARGLKRNVRKTDKIYRYGGDEFIILMPHTTAKSGKKLADKIKNRLGISVAVGVVKGNKNKENMLKIADSRLYDNKRKGG